MLWIVCIYMGLVHIYFPNVETTTDGSRYAQNFIDMSKTDISVSVLYDIVYAETSAQPDFYQPMFSIIISRFTDNPHILFMFFAFVFGFFFSRNIWYIKERLPKKIGFFLGILFVYYVLLCPPWNINGVRMWTALHVFVYGAMPFILEKDKSKIYWVFLSFFFHFSFILAITIFVIFYFSPKWINLFFVFYLFSILFETINIELLKTMMNNYLPSFFDRKVSVYTSQDYIEIRAAHEASLHLIISNKMVFWTIQIMIFKTYLLVKQFYNKNTAVIRLFSFSLFLYGIGNIFSIVPSGERYLFLAQMFLIPCIMIVFAYLPKWSSNKNFLYINIFLLLYIFIKTRTGLDYYGISLVMGNFISGFIWDDNIQLISFIKEFLT